MNENEFRNWYLFWIPILQKQYFKFRIVEDYNSIIELQSNIFKNWNMSITQKQFVWKSIKMERMF